MTEMDEITCMLNESDKAKVTSMLAYKDTIDERYLVEVAYAHQSLPLFKHLVEFGIFSSYVNKNIHAIAKISYDSRVSIMKYIIPIFSVREDLKRLQPYLLEYICISERLDLINQVIKCVDKSILQSNLVKVIRSGKNRMAMYLMSEIEFDPFSVCVLCCEINNFALLKYILDIAVDDKQSLIDRDNNLLLRVAAKSNVCEEMMMYLILSGADVSVNDYEIIVNMDCEGFKGVLKALNQAADKSVRLAFANAIWQSGHSLNHQVTSWCQWVRCCQ